MAKWRWFAESEKPRVIRDLGLPCTNSRHDHTSCPKHGDPVGRHDRICNRCWVELWQELNRRYASADQGAGKGRPWIPPT